MRAEWLGLVKIAAPRCAELARFCQERRTQMRAELARFGAERRTQMRAELARVGAERRTQMRAEKMGTQTTDVIARSAPRIGDATAQPDKQTTDVVV